MCATRTVVDEDEANKGKVIRVTDRVVEQRVSNLAQGLLFLVTMTGPLLVVLHLIPQGVLAGLFFVMGTQALTANGITQKILFLAYDRALIPAADPLTQVERKTAIYAFVAIQLLGFGATFAITQTIAAIGFPVIIIALIPVRTFVMPKYFKPAELNALDAPTAGDFVMESVGGAYAADLTDEDEAASSVHGSSGGRGPSEYHWSHELEIHSGAAAREQGRDHAESQVRERDWTTAADAMSLQEPFTSRGSVDEVAIDDSLERGEIYELRSHLSPNRWRTRTRSRRATDSSSLHRPRSRSTTTTTATRPGTRGRSEKLQ